MDASVFSDYDDQKFTQFTNPAMVHRDLETLAGILQGIIADSYVNVMEHEGLQEWLDRVKFYEFRQPYREVISIIRDAASDNVFTEDEAKNVLWFCNQYLKRNSYYNELTCGVLKLKGIVHGISMDKRISEDELVYLNNWMIDNDHLKTVWPYDELFSLSMKILDDGVITEEEHDELIRFCSALVSDDDSENKDVLSSLSSGFFHIDPEIIFDGRVFCITGISKKYKRSELAKRIENYGGLNSAAISKKLNYLIVCDEKNSCWAYTCYGRKIEEAMALRQKGVKISIVHELDLLDAFKKFE